MPGYLDDDEYSAGHLIEEQRQKESRFNKALDETCLDCRGFGYTKGGPNGPWEKLDCESCGGSGKKKQ